LEKAQLAKDEMEDQQRMDRKLRANYDLGISPGLIPNSPSSIPQPGEPLSAGGNEKKTGFFSRLFGYS